MSAPQRPPPPHDDARGVHAPAGDAPGPGSGATTASGPGDSATGEGDARAPGVAPVGAPVPAARASGVARTPTESDDRLVGPDVVRALALVGVVVMNYHGYLINRGADRGSGTVARVLDPFAGPLSTRFAATFVLTAGVGITLLTRRVVAERDRGVAGSAAAVARMRWRLVRRGMALYLLGLLLDIVWPGTIIVYYGAMFVLAAVLFTLATRWIAAVGAGVVIAAWALRAWVVRREADGGDVSWLLDPAPGSVRRVLIDVLVVGTHPLLPWLAFLCAGIVLGRLLHVRDRDLTTAALGAVLVGGAAIASRFAGSPESSRLLSLSPGERGGLYVASALGTALLAHALISGARRAGDGGRGGARRPAAARRPDDAHAVHRPRARVQPPRRLARGGAARRARHVARLRAVVLGGADRRGLVVAPQVRPGAGRARLPGDRRLTSAPAAVRRRPGSSARPVVVARHEGGAVERSRRDGHDEIVGAIGREVRHRHIPIHTPTP